MLAKKVKLERGLQTREREQQKERNFDEKRD
jgi:hypothetical protein